MKILATAKVLPENLKVCWLPCRTLFKTSKNVRFKSFSLKQIDRHVREGDMEVYLWRNTSDNSKEILWFAYIRVGL